MKCVAPLAVLLGVMGVGLPAAAQRVESDPMPIMMSLGCVESDGRGGFLVTSATEPEAMADRLPEQPGENAPLGDSRIQLVGTLYEFGVAKHEGHKVWVKGLYLADEDGSRLNLISITHISPSCS